MGFDRSFSVTPGVAADLAFAEDNIEAGSDHDECAEEDDWLGDITKNQKADGDCPDEGGVFEGDDNGRIGKAIARCDQYLADAAANAGQDQKCCLVRGGRAPDGNRGEKADETGDEREIEDNCSGFLNLREFSDLDRGEAVATGRE